MREETPEQIITRLERQFGVKGALPVFRAAIAAAKASRARLVDPEPPMPSDERDAVEAMRERCAQVVERGANVAFEEGEADFAEVCAAVASAIRALPAPTPPDVAVTDAWQPIETAPKDGTQILVARAGDNVGDDEIEITEWFETDWGGYEHVEGDLYRKVRNIKGSWNGNGHRATHWRPLPAPPRAALQAALWPEGGER